MNKLNLKTVSCVMESIIGEYAYRIQVTENGVYVKRSIMDPIPLWGHGFNTMNWIGDDWYPQAMPNNPHDFGSLVSAIQFLENL